MAKDAKASSAKSNSRIVPIKAQAPPAKSSEYVDDSDLESESESDDTPTTTKPVKAVSKSKDTTASSSESESSSEEEESESESEESSSDESVEETRLAGTKLTSTGSSKPAKFVPPSGFQRVSDDTVNTQSIKPFDISKDSGKQIWYFTAASSVPLNTIRDLTLQQLEDETPILSHNGTDYGFVKDAGDVSHVSVMLPKDDGRYRVAKQVDRVYHLQRMVRLPHLHDGLQVAAPVTQSRAPRTQPKGLKMRFKPAGFGDGEPGTIGFSSDAEDNDVEMAAPRFTAAEDAASSDEDAEMVDAPAVQGKEKKHKEKKESSKSKKSKDDKSSKKKKKTDADDVSEENPKKKKKHDSSKETRILPPGAKA